MWYPRRVVGNSMAPTYRDGQIVIVSLFRGYKINDVVVAYVNKREVIKRIKDISPDGRLYLIGDNLEKSTDSRSFGWVTDSNISGKVIWPKRMPSKQKL